MSERVPGEITEEEFTILMLKVDWGDYDVRFICAKKGIALNYLVNDERWEIRAIVAQYGYGLETLRSDPNVNVRKVAREAEKVIMTIRQKK